MDSEIGAVSHFMGTVLEVIQAFALIISLPRCLRFLLCIRMISLWISSFSLSRRLSLFVVSFFVMCLCLHEYINSHPIRYR